MDLEIEYTKAPITEALLDIQVEPLVRLTPSALAICQESVVNDYPTKREVRPGFATFDLDVNVAGVSAASQDRGYAFVSQDGKQVFQVRAHGFTANRLAPYTNWGLFSQEARRLWQIFRAVVQPSRITSIALRYINRFDIPASPSGLVEYFQTTPQIGRGLPQVMDGLFMQVALPLGDIKASLNMVETIVKARTPNTTSVVLDLDFFRTAELPGTEAELWALFELLRGKKNAVFEACITDKTRELIR